MNEKKMNEQSIEQDASAAKADAGGLAEVTNNELDQVDGGSRLPKHPIYSNGGIGTRTGGYSVFN